MTLATFTVYIGAVASATILWLIYVLIYTRSSRAWKVQIEGRPILRFVIHAMWYLIIADILGLMIISATVYFRVYTGYPPPVDQSGLLYLILFMQYSIIYGLSALPSTVLFRIMSTLEQMADAENVESQ